MSPASSTLGSGVSLLSIKTFVFTIERCPKVRIDQQQGSGIHDLGSGIRDLTTFPTYDNLSHVDKLHRSREQTLILHAFVLLILP